MRFLPCICALSLVSALAATPVGAAPFDCNIISIPTVLPGSLNLPAKSAAARKPLSGTLDDKGNKWMVIPSWLAGTWESRCQTYIYSYDYKEKANLIEQPLSISIRRESTRGLQKDARGQIWQYIETPYVRLTDKARSTTWELLLDMEPLQTSAKSLTVRCFSEIARISKSEDKVNDDYFEEVTTTYEPAGDGIVKVTCTEDRYDLDGSPRSSSKSVSTEHRTRPFQVIDRDERGDLHGLFLNFQKMKLLTSPRSRETR